MGEATASKKDLPGRMQRIRNRVRGAMPFLSGVLAALIALMLYNLFFLSQNRLTEEAVSTAIGNALASATPRPPYSIQVYRQIQPSLVMIETKGRLSEPGLGTGVVISDQGDILTSLHIVENTTEMSILFADGTRSDGFVAASQPEIDIAILRAAAPPAMLFPATLGNPAGVQVGDEAYVVGHPFGLYSSLSAGVVSGLNRTFEPPNGGEVISGLIQVDAAINPGNSGGPLLNRSGHVIGIVTGIINPTEDSFFVGVGFAVPINIAAGGAGLPPY